MIGTLAALGIALLLWPPRIVARARMAGLEPESSSRPRRSTLSVPLRLALVSGMSMAALGGFPTGVVLAAPTAVVAWWLTRFVLKRRRQQANGDFLQTAASLDLMAACLTAGLPVPVAVRAVAEDAPARAATALRSTADLLDLGADPVEAWAPVRECDGIAELARAARRTARSGAALAEVAADLSTRLRADLSDQAEAKAQRAGVLITGPLGLCFLPAFVCLGVAPVVAGLAGNLTIIR
jgi:Flp pilus assembly protein TadB